MSIWKYSIAIQYNHDKYWSSSFIYVYLNINGLPHGVSLGNDTFAIFASGLMHSRLWLTGDGDGDGDDDDGGDDGGGTFDADHLAKGQGEVLTCKHQPN